MSLELYCSILEFQYYEWYMLSHPNEKKDVFPKYWFFYENFAEKIKILNEALEKQKEIEEVAENKNSFQLD